MTKFMCGPKLHAHHRNETWSKRVLGHSLRWNQDTMLVNEMIGSNQLLP